MHPCFRRSDEWTKKVIEAAVDVHREVGPGLVESIYERCLLRECELKRIPAANQVVVPITYKGLTFQEPLKLDLLVDYCLILELKTVEHILPIHKAHLLSYMKLMDIPLGLLINFHEITLAKGITRLMLPGANRP